MSETKYEPELGPQEEKKLEITDNVEIQEIFDEDQEERKKINWQDQIAMQELESKDQELMIRLKKLVAEEKLKTGADYYHAAIIFQHGKLPDDYLKANELAKKSVELGDSRGLLLVATSWDRYLMQTNQPFQKYGTQYRTIDSKKELYPVDPNTTDEERAEFNVPPLQKLKEEEII